MKKKQEIMTCDICGKETSDEGVVWYGGHPFNGWLSIQRINGSSALAALQTKKDWDICSNECLIKLAKTI